MSTNSRTLGRPLSDRVQSDVFEAALRAINDAGIADVSLALLAEQAGVSRQTLYNRWGSVANIVLEALLDRGEQRISDEGSDGKPSLEKYLTSLSDAVSGWAKPGLRSLAALAQSDVEFAARFRNTLIEPRHARLTSAISKDVTVPEHADRIAELIAGSMWFRLLISGQELDAAWVTSMCEVATAVSGD